MTRPIRVDLGGLADFGQNLESVKNRMNGTRDMLGGYDGVFGHDDVSNALDDFEGGWKDGRKKIDGNAQRLVDISRDAVRAYTEGDQELATALTDGTREQQVQTYR
jgi:hypothetical protein